MSQAAEKFVALNKNQAETAIRAFQIGFNAWEMLFKLNLEATRSLLQEGVASVQVLPRTGDMTGLSAWTGPVRAGADKLSGYTRNVYEIAGQASSELGDLLGVLLALAVGRVGAAGLAQACRLLGEKGALDDVLRGAHD